MKRFATVVFLVSGIVLSCYQPANAESVESAAAGSIIGMGPDVIGFNTVGSCSWYILGYKNRSTNVYLFPEYSSFVGSFRLSETSDSFDVTFQNTNSSKIDLQLNDQQSSAYKEINKEAFDICGQYLAKVLMAAKKGMLVMKSNTDFSSPSNYKFEYIIEKMAKLTLTNYNNKQMQLAIQMDDGVGLVFSGWHVNIPTGFKTVGQAFKHIRNQAKLSEYPEEFVQLLSIIQKITPYSIVPPLPLK